MLIATHDKDVVDRMNRRVLELQNGRLTRMTAGGYTAMKFRNVAYYVKEATTGIWRNRLMSLASVIVVVLTLLILGAFILINLNIQAITEEIKIRWRLSPTYLMRRTLCICGLSSSP